MQGAASLSLNLCRAAEQEAKAQERKRDERQRTPRTNADLKAQRQLEKEWDKSHGVVYSRFNDRFQVNVRSYFDRWKEDEGRSYGGDKDPTWRLHHERPSLAKSQSEIIVPPCEANWRGNFGAVVDREATFGAMADREAPRREARETRRLAGQPGES